MIKIWFQKVCVLISICHWRGKFSTTENLLGVGGREDYFPVAINKEQKNASNLKNGYESKSKNPDMHNSKDLLQGERRDQESGPKVS